MTIRRRKQLQVTPSFTAVLQLRIGGAKSEAAVYDGGRVNLTGGAELFDNRVEIGGGRAMADTDDGEGLPVGLEILPGAWRGPAQHELEPEAAGVPRLVRERGLLVLRVEGVDG